MFFLHDLRLGLRRLGQAPGFTLSALLLLSLGIGATLAVYQSLYAHLLRPLPIRDADRIVQVQTESNDGQRQSVVSPALWSALLDGRLAQASAAVSPIGANLASGNGYPERVSGLRVSPGFFQVFGFDTLAGASFTAAHHANGGEAVVLLSEHLWARRFDRDRDLLGERLRLDGTDHRIIGVIDASSQVLVPDLDFVLPMRLPTTQRTNPTPYLGVFAYLPPGPPSTTELERLGKVASDAEQERRVVLEPIRALVAPGATQRFTVLMIAVGLALLVVCFNVGNLVFARAIGQTRNLVLRQVLGASPARLLRTVAGETVALVCVAGIGAIGVAAAVRQILRPFQPESVNAAERLAQTGGWTGILSGTQTTMIPLLALVPIVAVAVGAWPALRAVADAGRGLHAREALNRSSSGVRSALTAAQMAVTMVLLLAAALFLQTLLRSARSDLGFDAVEALTAQFSLPRSEYGDIDAVRRGFQRIVDAAASAPELSGAAALSSVPLAGSSVGANFLLAGRRLPADPVSADRPFADNIDATPQTNVALRIMSAGAVGTLGMRVLAGRAFGATETSTSEPVVIINASYARRLANGSDRFGELVGRALFSRNGAFEGPDGDPVRYRIIGIVADVRGVGLLAPVRPEITFPLAQAPAEPLGWTGNSMMIAALPATGVGETIAARALRRAAADVDPNLPLFDIASLSQRLDASLTEQRFVARLIGALGLFTLGLAAAGTYALAAFFVQSRQREFGLRMALGATGRRLVHDAASSSLRPAIGGLVAGTVAGVALVRLLAAQVPGSADPSAGPVVGSVLLLIVVAAVASWWPCRRVARLEPSRVLGTES